MKVYRWRRGVLSLMINTVGCTTHDTLYHIRLLDGKRTDEKEGALL